MLARGTKNIHLQLNNLILSNEKRFEIEALDILVCVPFSIDMPHIQKHTTNNMKRDHCELVLGGGSVAAYFISFYILLWFDYI